MEIIEHKMPDSYTLVQCGDIHEGPITCHTRGYMRMIDRVGSDPKCFLTNTGDNTDSVINSDKRYQVDMVKQSLNTPAKQRDILKKRFKPIRKQILAWGTGNHEMKLINTLDISQEIAEYLEVPFGAYFYKLKMMTAAGKLMNKMLFHHGRYITKSQAKDDIQREANYKAAVKRFLNQLGHTDCIYQGMSHTHHPAVIEPTIGKEIMIIESGGKHKQEYKTHARQDVRMIPRDARWCGVGGSFLRSLTDSGSGLTNYAEFAGYGPVELGWLELKVEDRELVSVEKVVV